MSSTNRGSERIENDAYFTPDPVARACVATLPIERGMTVWEPHAGGGAFVRALLRCTPHVVASDLVLRPEVAALVKHSRQADAREGWSFGIPSPDWIVGNPPYSDAQDHVEMALRTARIGVAFLLRLAFLEGQARAAFWRAHPCAEVHVLSRRPSFTGGKTDSCAYGWFVWRKDEHAPTTLHHLEWK